MDEIKILPWIGYSQQQAMAFGLNSTQAIIMNYIASSIPVWGKPREINGKTFWWCQSTKILEAMPTLDIKRETLRKNINDLVNKGLVEREIVGLNKVYFRVTEKWIFDAPGAAQNIGTKPPKMWEQYTRIINQIKKEKNGREIAEKMYNQLSSYLDENPKKENKFNLDGAKGGALFNVFLEWLEATRDGKNQFKISTEKEINKEYIDDIVKEIVSIGNRYDKISKGTDGLPTVEALAAITTEAHKMMAWYEVKKKTVKDLKSTARNWFNGYFGGK